MTRRDMNTRPRHVNLVTDSPRRGRRGPASGKVRSVPAAEWPTADQLAWAEAGRPAQRLKRGGAASHLAPVSQADIANRYGLYLDYLQRNGRLDFTGSAKTLVTLDDVQGFVAELQARVLSVTVWKLGLQAVPRRAVDRAQRQLRVVD
jgi:hypothetical protein